jgi:hypothetical protein
MILWAARIFPSAIERSPDLNLHLRFAAKKIITIATAMITISTIIFQKNGVSSMV